MWSAYFLNNWDNTPFFILAKYYIVDRGGVVMAKSKIIKDLANGAVDTQTALKRTKVLLQDLNNAEILSWVNNEIRGYVNDADVPEYRVIHGQLYGSYFKGSMANHMKYTNVPLPLGNMPDENKQSILNTIMTTAIGALKATLDEDKDGNGLSKSIPADFYPLIAHSNNDMYMMITSAQVKLNMPQVRNIFSVVESKLLDILHYLEKEFGVLDELDIDTESKTQEELSEINSHIYFLIYNDNSVQIGDNNKIKSTTIASKIDKVE